MKARVVIPAAVVLGFAGGYLAKRPPAGSVADTPAEVVFSRTRGAVPGAGEESAMAGTARSTLKSADSLADLERLEDFELYPRLALWLLDAGEGEMAEFWAGYRERPERDTWVVDLIFSQWTRLDPRGAIEAAKGSGHEGIPWWAWTINDPDAAIAAVKDESSDMAGFVMRAVGQFHPDRALAVLEENPEFGQWNGIEGVANGMARSDPEAALDFLRDHGQYYDMRLMKDWARDDPHAAFEWLRANPNRQYNRQEEVFLETLERENPEVLGELAAATPPGALRRKLEAAAFRNLVKENPDEARALARNSESPRLAAERFAELGRATVADDPGEAMAILGELFESCPDAFTRSRFTSYPGGSSSGSSPINGVSEFVGQLVAVDPQGTMDAASGQAGGENTVARIWLDRDLDGYATWLRGQEAGPSRDQGMAMVSTKLVDEKEFESAIQWATAIEGESESFDTVNNVMNFWIQTEPEAARAWLKTADLPERYQEMLNRQFLQP
ncbi:hypothetical protein [Luteolibacter marinus]|uniref:hypothetical protein n=1 Tax=Luteolibacter marinus TaxID=2776705 RepID=UPI001865EF4F|nr:hypothetical protein [Luteolibacter marinus]